MRILSRYAVVLANLRAIVLSDTPSKTSAKSVTIIKPRGILSKVDRKVKRDGISRLGASRVIAGKETATGNATWWLKGR